MLLTITGFVVYNATRKCNDMCKGGSEFFFSQPYCEYNSGDESDNKILACDILKDYKHTKATYKGLKTIGGYNIMKAKKGKKTVYYLNNYPGGSGEIRGDNSWDEDCKSYKKYKENNLTPEIAGAVTKEFDKKASGKGIYICCNPHYKYNHNSKNRAWFDFGNNDTCGKPS